MSVVRLEIGGRGYDLAVRDGQEAHFLALAETVDARCREAARAAGGLTEARQLLFAALLIADDAAEARSQRGDVERERDAAMTRRDALQAERAPLLAALEKEIAERDAMIAERDAARAACRTLEAEQAALRLEPPDPAAAIAMERLADRIEALVDGLEKRTPAP